MWNDYSVSLSVPVIALQTFDVISHDEIVKPNVIGYHTYQPTAIGITVLKISVKVNPYISTVKLSLDKMN